MVYTGLFNADNQQQVTIVNGSTYTGLYSPDGQFNGVTNDGTSVLMGAHHPCGAYNVTITTDAYAGSHAPNGSRYIIASSNGYALTTGSAISANVPFVPMTPLAGAAVDIDFTTGGSYPTALSTLMNAGRTAATGALLTAMQSPACSVLLFLKAAPTIPTSWVSGTGGTQSFIIRGATDTTATTRDNVAAPTTLTATAGSGAFSTTASKVCVMYDGSTGRSLVMNNGTVATDAQIVTNPLTSVLFTNVTAAFNRLTVYTSRLTDVAGKALTV